MGWRSLLAGKKPSAIDEARWVVLDVETSGLNAGSDRLISIAAIALKVDWARRRMSIHPGDSFEVVVRQPAAPVDRQNIVLHGIGVQQQSDGIAPELALAAFAEFAGASPLLAFHCAFDRELLDRYAATFLGQPLRNPWADIEQLCAVTHTETRARALDDWMAYFGITCLRRHQAAADTLAECEVLLRIWPRVAAQCHDWSGVARLAASHRWIRR